MMKGESIHIESMIDKYSSAEAFDKPSRFMATASSSASQPAEIPVNTSATSFSRSSSEPNGLVGGGEAMPKGLSCSVAAAIAAAKPGSMEVVGLDFSETLAEPVDESSSVGTYPTCS